MVDIIRTIKNVLDVHGAWVFGGTLAAGLIAHKSRKQKSLDAEWDYVQCIGCGRGGYSDEMKSAQDAAGKDHYTCARCSRPDIFKQAEEGSKPELTGEELIYGHGEGERFDIPLKDLLEQHNSFFGISNDYNYLFPTKKERDEHWWQLSSTGDDGEDLINEHNYYGAEGGYGNQTRAAEKYYEEDPELYYNPQFEPYDSFPTKDSAEQFYVKTKDFTTTWSEGWDNYRREDQETGGYFTSLNAVKRDANKEAKYYARKGFFPHHQTEDSSGINFTCQKTEDGKRTYNRAFNTYSDPMKDYTEQVEIKYELTKKMGAESFAAEATNPCQHCEGAGGFPREFYYQSDRIEMIPCGTCLTQGRCPGCMEIYPGLSRDNTPEDVFFGSGCDRCGYSESDARAARKTARRWADLVDNPGAAKFMAEYDDLTDSPEDHPDLHTKDYIECEGCSNTLSFAEVMNALGWTFDGYCDQCVEERMDAEGDLPMDEDPYYSVKNVKCKSCGEMNTGSDTCSGPCGQCWACNCDCETLSAAEGDNDLKRCHVCGDLTKTETVELEVCERHTTSDFGYNYPDHEMDAEEDDIAYACDRAEMIMQEHIKKGIVKEDEYYTLDSKGNMIETDDDPSGFTETGREIFEMFYSALVEGTDESDICYYCGSVDDVESCWSCDVSKCIECDDDEMRSDHDGHTYCDSCGPDSKESEDEFYVHSADEIYGPYDSLADAEDAVDRLSDKGIEIRGITRGKSEYMDAEDYGVEAVWMADSYDPAIHGNTIPTGSVKRFLEKIPVGQMFHVDFVKSNGEVREMNAFFNKPYDTDSMTANVMERTGTGAVFKRFRVDRVVGLYRI